MKRLLVSFATFTLLASLQAADTPGLLPNASFEQSEGDRPVGWRVYTTPADVAGQFYLESSLGDFAAHDGQRALQFYFPDGPELAQCVWQSDPGQCGFPVEPGLYQATFWIKAAGLAPGNHLWVSAVGYGPDGKRREKLQRSEFLNMNNLPDDEWLMVTFYFDVRPEDGIVSVSPIVVFKTSPDGAAHPVSANTRIVLDDLVIQKDQ